MVQITVPTNGTENWVLSSDYRLMFVAGDDGSLRAYDTTSGVLVYSRAIGGDLDAIAISPDGRTLAITDGRPLAASQSNNWTSNTADVALHLIDVSAADPEAWQLQTRVYKANGSEYVFGDVAFSDNDTIQITQRILPGWSGWAPLVTYETATAQFTPHGSYYAGGTLSGSLTASPTDTSVLLGQLGLSSAQYYLINEAGLPQGNNGIYENGVYGDAGGVEAISGAGAGHHIAFTSGGSLHLYQDGFTYAANLSNAFPDLRLSPGLVFSQDGSRLYALDPVQDAIVVIDTTTRALLDTIALGSTDFSILKWGDEIVADFARNRFFVNTTTGVKFDTTANVVDGTDGDDVLIGTDGPDTIQGGLGRDVLVGRLGDDTLVGGAGASNELYGGAGNDTYIVTADDSVIENANEGLDRVETDLVSFTLPANVEQLVYTGTGSFIGFGNALDNFIQGGAGDDSLWGGLGADTMLGGAGNDLIDGGSGAANEMIGGAGNDIYYVSVLGDSVVENAGEGTDMVRTSLDRYVLNANVESLVYTGTGTFNGVGSADANLIVGGAGSDILDGGDGNDVLVGGAGNDVLIGGAGSNELIGGAGNDIYYVSSTGDSVVEVANGGSDLVVTGVAYYVLGANVENLTNNGQSDSRGEGNELDNVIIGGFGNDVLLGHDGNDTIRGGSGNDLIEGGNGNDSIGGGDGNDTLTGGAGADRFVFDTAVGTFASNVDKITDFTTGVDGIQLDHNAFTALSVGALAEGQFRAGAVALDADDRILYDEATGTLYYDADGVGAGLAVAFATVAPTTAVAYTDFLVI